MGRLFRSSKSGRSPSAADADPLLAFESEQEATPQTQPGRLPAAVAHPSRRRFWAVIAAAIAAFVVAATAFAASNTAARSAAVSWFQSLPGMAAAPQPAKLTVTTRPEGAQVAIDGEIKGVTPLTLQIDPGEHSLAVRIAGQERLVALSAAPGGDIARDFEMMAPAPVTGALSIVTDPPGAHVTIDGRPSGSAPVSVESMAVGPHTIAVSGPTGSAERTVTVAAGHTASAFFTLPRVSGPVGGWLSVSVPFDVQVLERGDVLGASGSTRIMLAAGRHDITLVNETLGYQESRRVDIVAGQTSVVRVDPPKVRVNINARPWAEVTLDGQELGQTPISNATVTVGTHQLVFRHPQLGERRQSLVVTANGQQRVAVDLTK